MLVQQFRYDMSWQQDPRGGTITSNYGGSRGLEIIPSTRLEVGIFPPSYSVHQSNVRDGFGDFSYQVKFRAFSGTEGKGDYFVGFFFGGSVPTGNVPMALVTRSCHRPSPQPKDLPVGHSEHDWRNASNEWHQLVGRTLVFNTEVDYRIKGKIWPMFEQNSIFWVGGPLNGKKEVFLTPGLVVGAFPLTGRVNIGFGVGVQIAVSSFHQYNHRWIFSIRFPF